MSKSGWEVVSYTISGISKRGGARFELVLECGHTETRFLGSVYSAAPKSAKCKQCYTVSTATKIN